MNIDNHELGQKNPFKKVEEKILSKKTVMAITGLAGNHQQPME